MKKTFKLLGLSILLIVLLINIANAQTLVAGKVYDSSYDNHISGADIEVTCNSNILNTESLDDGTYAVRFETSKCGLGDSVSVKGVKDDLSGSDSGTVIECNEENNCAEGYVSIINLAIKSPASGNSKGGRYYYCGNNKCDTGESIATCPKDCNINITSQTNTSTAQATVELTIENNTQNSENNETQNKKGLITGAVIGAEGNTSLFVVIIFLSILFVFSIVLRIRNNKTITERI